MGIKNLTEAEEKEFYRLVGKMNGKETDKEQGVKVRKPRQSEEYFYINDDGAMNILVPFYKRVIKKIYEKRDEIKDINEIDEIYVIAFECLYKDDEETSNYIIYHKNMLCLSSVHSLYAILLNKFDDYNREIENDIMDLLKDVE